MDFPCIFYFVVYFLCDLFYYFIVCAHACLHDLFCNTDHMRIAYPVLFHNLLHRMPKSINLPFLRACGVYADIAHFKRFFNLFREFQWLFSSPFSEVFHHKESNVFCYGFCCLYYRFCDIICFFVCDYADLFSFFYLQAVLYDLDCSVVHCIHKDVFYG